jgi:hypothetical protein
MGFIKNVAKGTGRVVVREAKKSAKRTARTVGNKLFGQTYTKAAKKARSARR